tara:strand:- start:649 stop:759 length:111 start_codon:yes stop_codon:yes gene_type:complete
MVNIDALLGAIALASSREDPKSPGKNTHRSGPLFVK